MCREVQSALLRPRVAGGSANCLSSIPFMESALIRNDVHPMLLNLSTMASSIKSSHCPSSGTSNLHTFLCKHLSHNNYSHLFTVTAFRIGRFSKSLNRCAWALVVNQNSRALLAMRVSKRKTARVAGFWFTSIVPNSCFCLWRKAAERNMYNSKSTKRSLPTSIRRQSSMSNCHSLRTRILK